MSPVFSFAVSNWAPQIDAAQQQQLVDALESGHVVFLPDLTFAIEENEQPIFQSELLGRSKNISYLPDRRLLKGSQSSGAELQALQGLMARFAGATAQLTTHLLGPYCGSLIQARTSFRPVEIVGRQTSWRKDDSRLHVDNFPSSPCGTQRILRVFSNIDPAGQPRLWRVGEPFDSVARRYLNTLRPPLPGSSRLLNTLGITKTRRSAYDHFMLQLHDRMKADASYQQHADQDNVAFPAGSSWMAFTDQVSHAAMAGQFALEQTFMLPVESMRSPSAAPLRILEGLMHRRLA
ncbi:Kdo hydroxylase family protein [Pseudomonas sp. NPDC087358]|uniref:Kdo hydroxylase family protein n=1 Tax=Pseudomonas sp. NPDC087358 TaxID=3364439 RepID=UPI00384D92EF